MSAIPSEYYCQYCKTIINATDIYCHSCGKKLMEVGKAIRKTFIETFSISDISASVTIHNPKEVLANCFKDKKWFEGIVLSATYFEYYGKRKLEAFFNGKINANRINFLSLEASILLTFGLGLINQSIYCKIIEVKDKRNDLVHEPWTILELNETEAKHLIEKGIECLNAIYC